jgi:hypothetical protein
VLSAFTFGLKIESLFFARAPNDVGRREFMEQELMPYFVHTFRYQRESLVYTKAIF